ncbi:DUF3300 domain-containing protein [Duganella sp. CY15W]|uniref:DUF3300 domain-containing protein n=1 Tax=Duganella sp. CY15W TaxID=2692172 RepID=UPI00136C61B1|nr:DUF3300 domain-containing protein [Duganella sp. CY15W]MYM28139.1 DUF3300 domain-containing protein [Duganella sp. CY15W]
MPVQPQNLRTAISSTLILSLLTIAGCNKPADTPQQNIAAAPAAAPYTPPTAEQLSQMVAPIALFPDKLVAQVLAGATYPEQITAANQWLAQNPALKGETLQNAEAAQPWDVSVKSLTAFPGVLNQMAGNPQWTRSLGEAYVNDPNDVMNAIQAMRLRAQQAGNLKNSPQLRVSTTVRQAPPPDYAPSAAEPLAYAGPAVIPPPPQTIVIEPAEPDVVYVPQYNPTVVYGEPVAVYPGWVRQQPAYSSENLVTTGLLSFGVGVLVGAAINHHHDNGWHAWGVNWGAPHPDHYDHDGGWHRPAVVYNNATYISKSVTVVNHVNNYRITNNVINQAPPRPAGPMSMPHFNHRDMEPGPRAAALAPPPPVRMAAAPQQVQPAAPPAVRTAAPAHSAQAAPPLPRHDLHLQQQQPPQQHVAQQMPAPKSPPPAANPVHEHAAEPQQHSNAAQHMPQMAQHVEANQPHPPVASHDAKPPEHPQPHPARQDMLAMHNERPHSAPPAPAKPAPEKHEDNKHSHEHHG